MTDYAKWAKEYKHSAEITMTKIMELEAKRKKGTYNAEGRAQAADTLRDVRGLYVLLPGADEKSAERQGVKAVELIEIMRDAQQAIGGDYEQCTAAA